MNSGGRGSACAGQIAPAAGRTAADLSPLLEASAVQLWPVMLSAGEPWQPLPAKIARPQAAPGAGLSQPQAQPSSFAPCPIATPATVPAGHTSAVLAARRRRAWSKPAGALGAHWQRAAAQLEQEASSGAA